MKAMDELNWSVFGGHHFSIHHFIIQWHHAEIQVGEQAGKLFPCSFESSSQNLSRVQLEFFNLLLKFLNPLLEIFSLLFQLLIDVIPIAT